MQVFALGAREYFGDASNQFDFFLVLCGLVEIYDFIMGGETASGMQVCVCVCVPSCLPASTLVHSVHIPLVHVRLHPAASRLRFSAKDSLQVLGKGYITKGALDTRWCHYQTPTPTQKGEKPAPEDENDKDPLNSAFL
jgi:hypothetical protein